MNKKKATILALIIVILAMAAPTLTAIHLARKQALDGEMNRALEYARDVLHRSESASDQFRSVLNKLRAAGSAGPCSDESIRVMQGGDLGSSYIQKFGYVSGDRLICSSMGRHGEGIPLGPVDTVTASGSTLRLNVEFEYAPGQMFTVLELGGYAAVIHKDLPIDATTREEDVSLGTFTPESRQFRSSRGHLKQEWIDLLGSRDQVAFIDDSHVVAVVKSKRYSSGAVAALPVAYRDHQTQKAAMFLVPIGIIAGLALALAILFLARQQLAMPSVLRIALRRNEFFLNYQPIVDLKTGRWVGAEALIRWKRSNGEMVRPDVFIQAAEDAGLIQQITERVFEIVGQEVSNLFRKYPDFHIAINVSSADLHSQRTIERLRHLADTTGAGLGNLMIEATERGFMNDDAARAVVRSIRASGTKVAIDDFGTGYSSLSYLETFEIDVLKIDKSFVDTLNKEAATSQVVPHIIEMAKSLKLEMIAEGVENEAQAHYLRDCGVQYAQGWLFAKPMPFSELIKQLHKSNGTSQI